MDDKVAMVDNLVNLFIQGNALRAKKNKNHMTGAQKVNPVQEKTVEILRNLKAELDEEKSAPLRIEPKRTLVDKARERPENLVDQTAGLRFPVRIHIAKDSENTKNYDLTIGSEVGLGGYYKQAF